MLLLMLSYSQLTENQKNAIANKRWQHSPLRSILAKSCRKNRDRRLSRRDMSGMAMGLAFSAPSLATAIQGVSDKSASSQDRSNALFGGAFDLASTLLMFSGSMPGMVLGSVMTLSKTLFDDKPPPQLDPVELFKQVVEFVNMILPTPDQSFMSMKPFLNELMDNKMDIRFLEQYQGQQQRSLRIITGYLNQFQSNQSSTKIVSNYESMIIETSNEMLANKLPISVTDQLDFEYYEVSVAVAVYPQFISILLMAVKEWYLLSKRLNLPTEDIANKYYQFANSFQVHYSNMVNLWYNSWKKYILSSNIKKSDSSSCLLTFKVPNQPINQGYINETTAEPKYQFIAQSQVAVPRIVNKECRDPTCKFVRLLTDDAKEVCQFERIYKKDCKQPCSKTRRFLSFIFLPFGMTKKQCYKNAKECEYTQVDLVKVNGTCTVSECSTMLSTAVSGQMKQLELNVLQVRQVVVKFNSFLNNSDINDVRVLGQQLANIDSTALRSVMEPDQVFNGDVCSGELYIPKDKRIPAQCIIKTPTLYSCPTIYKNMRQYILYPDIYRKDLTRLCPGYIKRK
eukprot:NODE_29_length_33183_cov_0.333666.p2 type:complete len:567 gc:universal NODE_29_length_33183_cov_0.333666:17343-15643(-)